MPYANSSHTDFLKKAQKIVEENLSNELFGVSELAEAMEISRSYLHRKIISIAKTTVSQFIRQIRLKKAKELLRETSQTVAEIAYNVGYSSVTYFSKCFHDFYGYAPSEERRREREDKSPVFVSDRKNRLKIKYIAGTSAVLLVVIISIIVFTLPLKNEVEENIVAVLPITIYNSEQIFLSEIYGLEELIRSSLTDISDLIVVDRTLVEDYRNKLTPIPEIGRELNTKYIVESNASENENKIRLDIRLIEINSDEPIFGKFYEKDREHIWELGAEVVGDILNNLNVNLTTEEKKRIEKLPIENPIAYRFFSMGIEEMDKANFNYMCGYQLAEFEHYLDDALVNFKNAVKYDPKLSLAYANIAKIYNYKRLHGGDMYLEEILDNSNKASLYDPNSVDALISQAYYYRWKNEHNTAIEFLEKALSINPNSIEAVGLLSNIYGFRLRQADKFVEYAMKNVKLNVSKDSTVNRTVNYVAATALSRAGFFEEAHHFYFKSLDYKPDAFSSILGEVMNNCFEGNKHTAKQFITDAGYAEKDTIWGLENFGYFCFLMGDLDEAYNCLVKEIKKADTLRPGPEGRNFYAMYYLLSIKGKHNEAEYYLEKFKYFLNTDVRTRFKDQGLCILYSIQKDREKALKQLAVIAQSDLPSYRWIYQLEHSPVFDHYRDVPEFEKLTTDISDKFWAMHDRMEISLKQEDLLL